MSTTHIAPLALIVLASSASLALAETVEVRASALNLRRGPGTQHGRVGVLYRGQRYPVLARSGGWVKLRAGAREGWAYGTYLRTVAAAPAPAPAPATTRVVTAGALNVRSGPGTGYRRLGQLSRGAQVRVRGSSGAWRRIDYRGGAAWVHGAYLGASAPAPAPPAPSGPAGWDTTPPAANYQRTRFRGVTLNRRTVELLQRAERIMAGLGHAGFRFELTQGSYSRSVAASGGTHGGGGAVDIRTRGRSRRTVDDMVRSLRRAGFAAWSRGRGADSFAPHIHALALGDAQASSAARSQIRAYAAGRNGLRNNALDADRRLGRNPPRWARRFL